MLILVLGLILFLGIHSIRILSDNTRTQFINKHSDGAWKGVYSVVSLVGLVLIVYGYGQTRVDPIFLWNPPTVTRHIASILMIFAFVFLAAAYVPGNAIKAKVGHPMLVGIIIWALSHLIANGRLGDVVLFGAFLIWAKIDLIACVKRDRRAQLEATANIGASKLSATLVTIVVGVVAYLGFAMWLHVRLIGVSPFGV